MPGFNLNIRKVLEEAAKVDTSLYDSGNEIDAALSKADLDDMFEKICPISCETAECIKEHMCSVDNVRIMKFNEEFYIEYNEFANFCEATGMTPAKAANAIFDHYMVNGICKENFTIVFPSRVAYTSIMESDLGYQDIVWTSHFMKSCLEAGLNCADFE